MTTPTPTAKPMPLTAQATLAHYQREAAHAAELVELRQLREEVARLRLELSYIADAKFSNFEDANEFRAWATNRARHAIAANKEKP